MGFASLNPFFLLLLACKTHFGLANLDYLYIHIFMHIGFDPFKREQTLRERGLDFNDAKQVFEGLTATRGDDREDYGEDRYITIGHLGARCVVIVWTPRGTTRRIISMRYAHASEEAKWLGLGRSR